MEYTIIPGYEDYMINEKGVIKSIKFKKEIMIPVNLLNQVMNYK